MTQVEERLISDACSAECTPECGGRGPDDPKCCVACRVYHRILGIAVDAVNPARLNRELSQLTTAPPRVLLSDLPALLAHIDRLTAQLEAAERVVWAAEEVANHPHKVYDNVRRAPGSDGAYETGVVDGHRCAASHLESALADYRKAKEAS